MSDLDKSDSDEGMDRRRTTRPRSGLVFKDRREVPGLALLIVGVLALMGFAITVAQRDTGWSVGFGITGLVLAAAGSAWVLIGRRRTTRAQDPRRQT